MEAGRSELARIKITVTRISSEVETANVGHH